MTRTHNQKIKKLIIVMIIFSVLAACTPFVHFKYHHLASSTGLKGVGYGAAAGAIIAGLADAAIGTGTGFGAVAGGLIGADLASEHHWLYKLQQNGIQVIQVGEYVKIILPSDQLFYFNSATLIPNNHYLLDLVYDFLHYYGPPCHITIVAFTDNVLTPDHSLPLSRHQAQSVLGYLWNRGIPYRRLKAIGMGSAEDIASNADPEGSAYNRRVEIRFRTTPYYFHC